MYSPCFANHGMCVVRWRLHLGIHRAGGRQQQAGSAAVFVLCCCLPRTSSSTGWCSFSASASASIFNYHDLCHPGAGSYHITLCLATRRCASLRCRRVSWRTCASASRTGSTTSTSSKRPSAWRSTMICSQVSAPAVSVGASCKQQHEGTLTLHGSS